VIFTHQNKLQNVQQVNTFRAIMKGKACIILKERTCIIIENWNLAPCNRTYQQWRYCSPWLRHSSKMV